MNKYINQKNSSLLRTSIALLLCMTFFAFYTINRYDFKVTTFSEVKNQTMELYKTKTKDNDNENINNKNILIKDQVNLEYLDDDKYLMSSQYNLYDSTILCNLILLFVLMNLFIIFLYFRGWLVKALKSRYKLYLIRYIQLTDGKKESNLQTTYHFI